MTLPESWTEVPVTGTFTYYPSGDPVAGGRIEVRPLLRVLGDNAGVIPALTVITLDGNGAVPAATVLPSYDDVGRGLPGVYYKITERFQGAREPFVILVRHDDVSVNLATEPAVVPGPDLVSVIGLPAVQRALAAVEQVEGMIASMVVAVTDEGVSNDGVTDINAALLAIINDRPAGASLRFPKGDYYLVGSMDATLTSPLTLTFDAGARIVGDASEIPMLMIRGGVDRHRLTVIGGHVDNADRVFNAAVQSGTGLALFDIDDWLVVGTTFGRKTLDWPDNFGDAGITANKCQRGTTFGSTFYGQPDLGIYLTGGALTDASDDYGDNIVMGCRFHKCKGAVSAKRQSQRTIFIGNTVNECYGGVNIFEASAAAPGRGGIVQGNTFKKTQRRVVRIHGLGDFAVQGNLIEDFGFDRSLVSGVGTAIYLNGASGCNAGNNIIRFKDWVSDANHSAVLTQSAIIDGVVYPGENNHVGDNTIINVHTAIKESAAGVNYYPDNTIIGATTPLTGINTGSKGSYFDGTNRYTLVNGVARREDGTWTPTLTNTTNVSSSTAYACPYARVGNTVMFSGKVSVTCTANSTNTEIRLSLPIPATFTADEQAGGTANPGINTGAGAAGSIYALSSGSQDQLRVRFVSGAAAAGVSRDFHFSGSYRIP